MSEKDQGWKAPIPSFAPSQPRFLSEFDVSEPPPASGSALRQPLTGILTSLVQNPTAAAIIKVAPEKPAVARPLPPKPNKSNILEEFGIKLNEKPKSPAINFQHGNKKPFSVTFHFGTKEHFVGYRRPETRFTVPSFTLSRPILFNGDAPEQVKLEGASIICMFSVQMYRVSKDDESKKEFYVDVGTGTLSLQSINGTFVLSLYNDRPMLSLRLMKGIKPRTKPEFFVQIYAEELPACSTGGIFLIRCDNSSDASELCKAITDSVLQS